VDDASNIREVTGSNPVPPTVSPVLTGHESSVLALLILLFGQGLKRRYILRQTPLSSNQIDTIIAG
jgi:hypothetical protein